MSPEMSLHTAIVSSLKKPLRLGLTFYQVGGLVALSRGDSINDKLSQHGYTLAIQVARVQGDYLSFMEAF